LFNHVEVAIKKCPRRLETKGLGTHLFVKIPRPRDNEGTFSIFELSCLTPQL